MKRSEMLYLLTEMMNYKYEIVDDYREGRLNYNQLTSKLVEAFVDELENKKLINPPKIAKEVHIYDFDTGKVLKNDVVLVNEWEKE